MKLNVIEFRRKILFFAPIIAGIFLVHLIWVYIYEDGVSMWVRGGSINIGIVGKSPGIPNPLNYSKDKYEDLVLKFLYRPLIRYDASKGEYQGDIGTCDISDLAKVHCILKKDQYWSDKTKIQVEDIIATYQALRTSGNDKLSPFMKNVTAISRGENEIEISAKEKNSLMLDVLTYPIIRSDMIERIKTGRISPEWYITSWPYSFSGQEHNGEFWFDRITLVRDEKNGGEWWLDRYNFLFFPDLPAVERSTDNLSIIIPPVKNEKLILWPRFAPYKYSLYEYIGLFANTDRLSKEIRQQFIGKIAESFSGKVDMNEAAILNIFSLKSTGSTDIKLSKNFSDVMKSLGYMKPDESLTLLRLDTGILTGVSIDYGKTAYFTQPTNKKIFFSEIAGGEILLGGTIPNTTIKVAINGYELKEYIPGDLKFLYRVSLQDATLSEGKNTYTVELTESTNQVLKDTITIYYSTQSWALQTLREGVDTEYLKLLNTPEKVQERRAKSEKLKEKIKVLDPKYYYNAKNEPFEVKIAYKDDPLSLEGYANNVSVALQSLSIKSKVVPISTKDLQKMLESGNKDYDYIIIGFEANGRLSRIGQVFLSSEAKNGINFSKIESKKLDALFASLRIASGKTETESIERDILTYMGEEWFFYAISNPIHTLYIDKNLKGVASVSKFQDISTLHSVLKTSSIKDTYVIRTDGKWIVDFLGWIWKQAFP